MRHSDLKKNIDAQKYFVSHRTAISGGTITAVFTAAALSIAGWLPLINAVLLLLFIPGLYGLITLSDSRRALVAAVLMPSVLVGFFIAVYRPAGFNYPLIWNPGVLYEGGSPFSLYINTSKAMTGYLIAIWLWGHIYTSAKNHHIVVPLWEQCLVVTAGVSAIIFTACAFFGVDLKPKWPDGILYFFGVNLLVTVLAEEAFFRLLLQSQIERFFSIKKAGLYAGVAVSSIIFALAHAGAGGAVFFLFLFAGFVYAVIYAHTRSLIASIATHFGVNIVHLTLLEYPL